MSATKSNKSNKSITTDSAIKADAAVETKSAPVVSLYNQLLAAVPASTPAAKSLFDSAVTFTRSIGAPDRFSLYRDEVLSACGRMTGTSKWSDKGSDNRLPVAIRDAMTAVAKHEATKSKEQGDAAKVALSDLKRALGLLKVLGANYEFTVGE